MNRARLPNSAHPALHFASSYPWRYAGWLIVPLTLALCYFKLVKYVLLIEPEPLETAAANGDAFAGVILPHLPIPVLLILLGFVIAGLLQQQFAILETMFLPTASVVALVAGAGFRVALPQPPAWMSFGYVESIRAELLVAVLLYALIVFVLRGVEQRRFGTIVLIVVHVVIIGLFELALFDFGYFVKTGSLADSYLLTYALRNLGDLRFAVGYELSGVKSLLVVLPFVLTLLPVVASRISNAAAVGTSTLTWRLRAGFSTSIACFAALLFLPRADLPEEMRPIEPAIYVTLARSMADLPSVDGHPGLAVPFSTEPVAWTRTDSTKSLNVVVIVLESTRASAVTPYNRSMDTTPFLDSLGHASIMVDRMLAVVPHTNKALVPILCGVFPELNQGKGINISKSCLPQLLAPHGYRSTFITPAMLAFEEKGELLQQMGYDDIYGDGDYDASGFTKVNYFGYQDDIILPRTADWLDARVAAEEPFLATFLTLTPHQEYGVPASFDRRPFSRDPTFDDYLNTVAYQDEFLRRLFGLFADRDLIDNTLFVLVGDHGEAFGEHGLYTHSSTLFEEGLHVPMILVAPEGAVGRLPGTWQQVDIVPSIADLLHYRTDGYSGPGRSVLRTADPQRRLYSSAWIENRAMAVEVGSRKYIYRYRRVPMSVYDIVNDPMERVDIAPELSADELKAAEMDLLMWRSGVNKLYQDARRNSF